MSNNSNRTATIDWRSHTIAITTFVAGIGSAMTAAAGFALAAVLIGAVGLVIIAAAAFGPPWDQVMPRRKANRVKS